MKGYLFNSILVAGGSLLGLLTGSRVPETLKESVFSVLGLITLFVGVKMSMNGIDAIPIVFCLVLGMLLGSGIRMEARVERALQGLNGSWSSGKFDVQGFLTASTLFCVGSMTVIGSLKDGLYQDDTLIKTKSVMDAFASFLLASRYGISVLFSAVTVLLVQGALTFFSGNLTMLTAPRIMNNIDGVGGLIVMAIGLNLLGLKTIKTVDMLPSLILIVLYGLWFLPR